MRLRLALCLLLPALLVGCDRLQSALDIEGDEPGECTDDADNDRDGLFDCKDPDCAGSAACSQATPAATAQATATPPRESLDARSIVLMGGPGSRVEVYDRLEVAFEDSGPGVLTGEVIARLPAGTRGTFISSVYAVLSTFGAEVELADGTRGYVLEGTYGSLARVVDVASDDVLNVRAGRTHTAEKVAELAPGAAVFIVDSSGAAGCEVMEGEARWFRVRTLEGVEGWASCRYLGSF